MNQYAALRTLLLEAFEPTELHTLLWGMGRRDLCFATDWTGGSAEVTDALVGGLERFGDGDAEFFQGLVNARPKRFEQIRAVAELWIGPAATELRKPAVAADRPPVHLQTEMVKRDRIYIRDLRDEGQIQTDVPRFQVAFMGYDLLNTAASLPNPQVWTSGGLSHALGPSLDGMLELTLDDRSPSSANARAVVEALQAWGAEVFQHLFGGADAARHYHEQRASGAVEIVIQSPDPHVLAWPWEAVGDSRELPWGLDPRVCLTRAVVCLGVPEARPARVRERLHVLLITARPFDSDVGYLDVSNGIVDLPYVSNPAAPVDITLLRPPTFAALQAELSRRPPYYHVLHFDGHGGLDGNSGALYFEQEGAPGPDLVRSDRLGALLFEHNLPIVVLNACRSAMQPGGVGRPFASVAAGLLKANTGAVVAMSHSLSVDGARQFTPAFYKELLHSGEVAAATGRGRFQMHSQPARRGRHQTVQLADWMIPVTYSNGSSPLEFDLELAPRAALPSVKGLDFDRNLDHMVGRGSALRWLDQRVVAPMPGVVVQGDKGIGKTLLAQRFLVWLYRTGAPGVDPVWMTCSPADSAKALLARLAEALGVDAEREAVGVELRRRPRWVVVDDFQNAPADVAPLFNDLLLAIEGRPSRLLFLSRSRETMLNPRLCVQLKLDALDLDDAARLTINVLAARGVFLDPQSALLTEIYKRTKGIPARILARAERINSIEDVRELCARGSRDT